MHREVGGSGYGVDGKEDGEQDEEGVTADRADEILKKFPHYLDTNTKSESDEDASDETKTNSFFNLSFFQLPRAAAV